MAAVNQNLLAQMLLGMPESQRLQQQTEFGDQLQQQGMTPIDQNNRMVGGVMSRISPMEGLAKIAQSMLGAYEKKSANQTMADKLSAAMGTPSGGIATGAGGMPQGNFMQNAMMAGALGLPPDVATAYLANNGDTGATQKALSQQYLTNEQRNAAASGLANPVDYAGSIAGVTEGAKYPYTQAGKAFDIMAPNMSFSALQGAANPGAPRRANVPPMPMPSQMGQGAPNPAMVNQAAAAMPQGAASPAGIPIDAMPDGQGAPNPANQPPQMTPGDTPESMKARNEIWKAGQTAQAADAGKNLAEAKKGEATIDSRIQSALDTIKEMQSLAPSVTSGAFPETQRDFARTFQPERAGNNSSFDNLNARLFIQELPAIISGAGGRGNQFLERAIKEAGAINENDPPAAKLKVLTQLKSALSQAQGNAKNLVTNMGGQPAMSRVIKFDATGNRVE